MGVDAPGTLTAAEFTEFWVAWKNDALIFGKGGSIGSLKHAILYLADPSFLTINYFATRGVVSGSMAYWRLPCEYFIYGKSSNLVFKQ